MEQFRKQQKQQLRHDSMPPR
jgi:hypothetical protein